jgi:hypothetical protein
VEHHAGIDVSLELSSTSFVTTIDPVGGGWVESLSRPGTNAKMFVNVL